MINSPSDITQISSHPILLMVDSHCANYRVEEDLALGMIQ